MSDLVLPAFELDCRHWLVVGPAEAGLPEHSDGGAPVLAVLSTLVIDRDVHEVTGALTVGVLDEREPLELRPVAPGSVAQELLDDDPDTRRFVMPSPTGNHLALVAEFRLDDTGGDACGAELGGRVEELMASFRWQAA